MTIFNSAMHDKFTEQLKNEVSSYLKLSDDDWQLFASKMKLLRLNKGELFTKSGSVEQKVDFIVSGSMRFYQGGRQGGEPRFIQSRKFCH